MSQEDLSRQETHEGGASIHCTPLSDVHGAGTTAKGWNYLRRVLAGIAVA